MAWEKRDSRRYYYRKRRSGQTVVSEYVGSGDEAERAAAQDSHERHEVKMQKGKWRKIIEDEGAVDRSMREATAAMKMLTDATLLVSGYRTHRRQWRKRRGNNHGQE